MKTARAFPGICFVLCYALTASGAEISGHIQFISAPGQGVSTAIVYAEALGDHAPVKPGRYQMIQHNKTFSPHVLAVPVGSTVSFPNADPIFHNVFSMSPSAPFDLGLYRAGMSKTLVFTEPAIYRVFCNIHPQMMAQLLVLPTQWITESDAQGTYRMDLPPGRYRLTAWSERSSPVTVPIAVELDHVTVPNITLDESHFVEVRHKHKYGQDYPNNSYAPLRR
jgi:plastocyanin